MIFQLISPFITNNPHCKLKCIKLEKPCFSKVYDILNTLYCILDSQDQLEILKLEISSVNFKYSIFSRPTFKELAIHGDISMDSYVYIMQQFFLSPYPVTLKFYKITISGHHYFQIPPVQLHPTQHSKTLELYYCCASEELRKCLPSTVHLKKLVLQDCVEYFSKLDNITVDECISVSASNNMDDLNDLFHITTAKEWNITVKLSEDTQDKFIVALSNIKGVVTKLCICVDFSNVTLIAEAIFTCLQSSLPQLDLSVHGYQSSHVRELYEIWKQCGSIQLKKLKLVGYRDDDTVRDIVALISKTA